MRLRGKVAIVTGSTKGVGAEIAVVYAQQGAYVVVTGRSVERGRAVVEDILASGGKAIFVESDLASEHSVRNLVDRAMAAYGRVDILVDDVRPDVAADEASWCSEYVIPRMVAVGGGSVINISSTTAPRSRRMAAGRPAVRVNTIRVSRFAPRMKETAELAVYLGSDESRFVTASELTVDAGSTVPQRAG